MLSQRTVVGLHFTFIPLRLDWFRLLLVRFALLFYLKKCAAAEGSQRIDKRIYESTAERRNVAKMGDAEGYHIKVNVFVATKKSSALIRT